MPPTHPSQADVVAAYRTLIAYETEPKEQDFYRTRLQRLEQTTEPVCEFDCRSRVAAAGVGVYCPQCSAKSADTDLATQLAKAIRAAWVDRLDWDELAQAALKFLTSTGRLVPAGGMALTAEQVEDVRKLSQMDPWWSAEHVEEVQARVRALFPATEPAEDGWGDVNPNDPLGRTYRETAEEYYSAPAEPAEEETKAELCAVRLCVLPARHSGVHADREGLRWNNPASSPVVPTSTETEWQTLDAVPAEVRTVWDKSGTEWRRRKNGGWKWGLSTGGWFKVARPSDFDEYAPFVAAEER